ncbi:hypothetical protein V3C99_010889 [Haemonchus contortus]
MWYTLLDRRYFTTDLYRNTCETLSYDDRTVIPRWSDSSEVVFCLPASAAIGRVPFRTGQRRVCVAAKRLGWAGLTRLIPVFVYVVTVRVAKIYFQDLSVRFRANVESRCNVMIVDGCSLSQLSLSLSGFVRFRAFGFNILHYISTLLII